LERLFALSLPLFTGAGYNALSQKKELSDVSLLLPYKIQFQNFPFGNFRYIQKVLFYWKDYCENTMDKSADLFTDDVVQLFPMAPSLKESKCS
jgi:hypothetical protein